MVAAVGMSNNDDINGWGDAGSHAKADSCDNDGHMCGVRRGVCDPRIDVRIVGNGDDDRCVLGVDGGGGGQMCARVGCARNCGFNGAFVTHIVTTEKNSNSDGWPGWFVWLWRISRDNVIWEFIEEMIDRLIKPCV